MQKYAQLSKETAGRPERPLRHFWWLLFLLAGLALLINSQLQTAQAEQTAAPTVSLASYYGGSTEECLFATCSIDYDDSGNIYIAGMTRSDDFPLVNEYSDVFSSSGASDIFVVKLNGATKDVLFSTYIGPGSARNIAVDDAGNVHIVGFTSDSGFPTTVGAQQTTYQGGVDGVYVKLKADGSELLYSTFIGGSARDEAADVAVGPGGQVYLTGYTESTDFPTKDAAQSANAGQFDGFVMSFTSAGALTYSTYFGGERRDQGWGIAVDESGAAYVTGQTGSDDFPTTAGVIQPDRFSNAGNDAYMIKHNASGALEISTYFNQFSTEEGVDIAVDEAGNQHILLKQQGILKLNASATGLFFLTDIDLELNVGGEGGMVLDKDGNIFATGWTGSGLDKDIVLAAVSPSGRLIHWQEIGGSDTDHGHQLALFEAKDGSETIAITGFVQSNDFPTQNPIDMTLGGTQDAVIIEVIGIEDLAENLVFIPLVVR